MPTTSARLPVSLMVGEPFGEYTLLRKLATGGMAEVFLARRRSSVPGFAKLVAIKRMLPHLAEDPEFITMFMDEARTASHLNHPNIVQIFDVGEALGTLFLAMEFLDGISVMTVLQRNIELRHRQVSAGTQRFLPAQLVDRPLDPMFAAAIGVQASQGLHYAHELTLDGEPMGLVHRDVSPQNLLLTFGGVVKLLDFGIAKAAGRASVTRAGALKGKLRYMAPEQLLFKPVDRRADVYSLGVVLYELATATRAFSGEDWEIVQQVQRGQLPPAHHVRAEVPAQLSEIIARAMAVPPEDRYPTAAALGEALLGAMRALGKVLTSVDVSEMAQRRFGEDRVDVSPFVSAEHRALSPAARAAAAERTELQPGGSGLSAAEQEQQTPAPGPAAAGGAIGSAPPEPALGWLLHGYLSLSARFRPRHFWLYPLLTSVALASLLSFLAGRLLRGPLPPGALRVSVPIAQRRVPPPAAAPAQPPAAAPAQPPPAAPPAPVVAAGSKPEAPGPEAPPARPVAARPARQPSRPGRGYGYLIIDSKPTWSRVFAYGQLLGQTPIVKRTLPAGWITVKVINGQTRAQRAVRVLIKKGEVTTTLVRWQ